jgi:polysaccharide pyruvyl transferase WcaK-like protein
MEYQPKNADFAASLDWNEYNIDIRSLTAEKLINKTDKLLQENESNIRHLQESVSEKCEQLQSSASEINQKWLT